MKNDILIIMPAYNEADGIGTVIADIRTKIPYADILVINDGSLDDTGRRAEEAGALVVNLSNNLGIGGAVQTGYRFASLNGYKMAAQMDGDGQHNAADFAKMLKALKESGTDMVVGSRFVENEGFQSTFTRKIGINLLAGLVTSLVRKKITDPTSGYRLCGERALGLFAKDYPSDYPEVEALILLDNVGFSFKEVPVIMNARMTGTSSISPLKSIYYMIKVILAVMIAKSRKKKSWSVRYEG
jgi:glycosyltransferase involved in cell wall biosynthesis